MKVETLLIWFYVPAFNVISFTIFDFPDHYRLFSAIDEDNNGKLSASELKALIVGIRFDEIDFDRDDAVKKVMKDFDTSQDNSIDLEEFINGISKWVIEAKRSGAASVDGSRTLKFFNNFHLVSCTVMIHFNAYTPRMMTCY